MDMCAQGRKSLVGLGLSLMLAGYAHASFELDGLERFGGVKVEGYLEYQDYDFSRMVVRSDGIGFHDAGLNTLDHTIALEGLGLTLPYVTVSGTGQATQHSEYDGTTLRFQAANNIAIESYAGVGALFGTAAATSSFQATFLIHTVTVISLTMSSAVDPSNASYQFSLAKNTGEVAWNRTFVESSGGQNVYGFTRQLTLTPGFYTLDATLKAMGGIDPAYPSSISTPSAMFEVSVVPEPASISMLAAGLVVVAGAMRRMRLPGGRRLRLG